MRRQPWTAEHGRRGVSEVGVERMRVVESLTSRLGIAGELIQFFWQHKWWWLTPMLLVLLLFGALVILAQRSAIAPFIYTLF